MEEQRLRHTAKVTNEGIKRVRQSGTSAELQEKIRTARENRETPESNFIQGVEYITDNFSRQADGLRALRSLNDSDERQRRSLPLLLRRKEALNSLQAALESEAFTDLEREQLRYLYDIGSAFTNYISKNLGIFETQYNLTRDKGSVLSNVTAAETQQCLAELLVTRTREASDVPAGKDTPVGERFLEETVFPLFHTMAVRAMGLEAGTPLYDSLQSGVYGLAAAYFAYSDASQNSFGKSFRVLFPSPYLDALEQTDLILVDDANIPADIRNEIVAAINRSIETEPNAINALSSAAKRYVYKIQVKVRSNGPKELTAEELAEKERFLSARCRSKGFDNGDYIVFSKARARSIVGAARKESQYGTH